MVFWYFVPFSGWEDDSCIGTNLIFPIIKLEQTKRGLGQVDDRGTGYSF